MGITLGVLGSSGFMGSCLRVCAQSHPQISSVKGWCRADGEEARQTLFEGCDVVIDFSHASAAKQHVHLAYTTCTPLLLGTTGSDFDAKALSELADNSGRGVVMWAPNTSLGMAWMVEAVEKLAPSCPDVFSPHIIERHHARKRDAPSGTALALQRLFNCDTLAPISSLREGECVGEHTVIYRGQGETLTLTHKATDRRIFAQGALAAAAWLITQPSGLYTFQDFIHAQQPQIL